MSQTRQIYCCGCGCDIIARLTDGREIYPHRKDLAKQPFWKCFGCGNYVGCHWKTDRHTRPLGNIPTPEIRNARGKIHAILDPIWKDGRRTRKEIYAMITGKIGRQYHTAEIRSMEEAREIYRIIRTLEAAKP